jgi:hypothetical protein
MFNNWLNPIFFLLSMFGMAPLLIVNDEGKGTENTPAEITNETDLFPLSEDPDQADLIFEREDVDIDKYLEALNSMRNKPEDQRHIYLKDVKVQSDGATGKDKKDDDIQDDDITTAKETSKTDANVDQTNKTNIAAGKTVSDNKISDATKVFIVDDKQIADRVAKFTADNKEVIKDPAQLAEAVDNFKRILESVKGDPYNEHNLKVHINAQTYIKNLKSPFAPDWKPDPKVTQTPEYIDKAIKHKNNVILNRLQSKFDGVELPLFPKEALESKEARREFEKELIASDPSEFNNYQKMMDDTEKGINEDFDKWQYIDQNWETMAADTIKTDVMLFKNFLVSQKVKPEDIGLPDLNLNESFYNQFLYENVLYKGKNPNDDVFSMYRNKYPIVKPGAILNSLTNIFLDSIIAKREEAARIEGYEFGKKDTVEPGMSNSSNPGEREIIDVADDESILDESYTNETKDAYEARIDKWLNNTRNKVLGKRK